MAEVDPVNGADPNVTPKRHHQTLSTVLHRVLSILFHSDLPLTARIRSAFSENAPLLKDASTNSARNLLQWTRRGSPLRALLVVSVGTIALLTLTGLLVFMLFFLAATVNAVVICLLVSLAAAGGFLAFFFACLTVVYVGALSVAIFVISTVTICAVAAVLIATGWIGFFCTVWLVTKKGVTVAKNTWSMTGSAILAYSPTRHGGRYTELDKDKGV